MTPDFANELNRVLKYGADLPPNKHNAKEVLPNSYVVVKSGILHNRPDKIESRHKSLADAWDALHYDSGDWTAQRPARHLYAVYPDKSMKLLNETGGETPLYHERLNGGGVEHTTDYDDPNWQPSHDADAAPVSQHRVIQRALTHAAWNGLGRRDLLQADIPTGKGTQAHGLVRQAMETGDLTPILVLADHLQEQLAEKDPSTLSEHTLEIPQLLRDRVELARNELDDLKTRRVLRVG